MYLLLKYECCHIFLSHYVQIGYCKIICYLSTVEYYENKSNQKSDLF